MPKILILGSMPGAVSLQKQEYYAHPRNRFWGILFRFFHAEFSSDYFLRKQLIIDGGIALWDSLGSCKRENSSLDSKITNEKPNNIRGFLAMHPSIGTVFVNGKKSETSFKEAFPDLACMYLPSTSPANAAIKNDDLYTIWTDALFKALKIK